MWQVLAVATDLLHAMLMGVWVIGLPLLVWHRWPSVTRAFAVYAILFVAASQASRWLLGECFVTTIALFFWEHVPSSAPVSKEWFTVRLAQAVFHSSPSHRAVVLASEAAVVATAAMATWSLQVTGRTKRSPKGSGPRRGKAGRHGGPPSRVAATPTG
jgi:hypothetical protein